MAQRALDRAGAVNIVPAADEDMGELEPRQPRASFLSSAVMADHHPDLGFLLLYLFGPNPPEAEAAAQGALKFRPGPFYPRGASFAASRSCCVRRFRPGPCVCVCDLLWLRCPRWRRDPAGIALTGYACVQMTMILRTRWPPSSTLLARCASPPQPSRPAPSHSTRLPSVNRTCAWRVFRCARSAPRPTLASVSPRASPPRNSWAPRPGRLTVPRPAGAYRIGRRGPAYQARLLHGLLMFQAGDAVWNGFLALLQQVFSSVSARDARRQPREPSAWLGPTPLLSHAILPR
jgi:hypothetical protein